MNQLAEAKTVLKRRKKSVDKFLDGEMAKRGFVLKNGQWRRMTNA